MILLILLGDVFDDINDIKGDDTKSIKTTVVLVGVKGLIKRVESYNKRCRENNTKSQTVKMISDKLTLHKSVLQKIPWISAGYFTHSKDGAISRPMGIIRSL